MTLEVIGALVLAHVAVSWILAILRGSKARRQTGRMECATEQPPVSILVPAWQERGTLEQCIQALKKITYPVWEVVVLAGGLDGTYEAALQATGGDDHFRVLERGPEPKNVALSRGMGAAHYDVLVLLDADSIVSPGWLDALVVPLAFGASVSLGDCLPKRETWVSMAEQMQNIQMYQITKDIWIQGDRSMAIRREALARIGGLLAHTYAREDWDLWVKWANAKEKIAFARGARLWTERPATLRELWTRDIRWRRTHLAGLWEHRDTLLRRPRWAVAQCYMYGFSAVLIVVAIIGLILAIGQPSLRPFIGGVTALIALWLSGRRAALGAEVAVYTGEKVWLWRAWSLVIVMFVNFPACIVAMLSVWRGTPFDYKGPRELRTI